VNPFDIISLVMKLDQSMFVPEAINVIHASESAIVSDLGGADNKWLRPLLIYTIEQSVNITMPSIVLSDGAGPVVDGGLYLNDAPATLLGSELRSIATSNFLMSDAAFRQGNVITFINLLPNRNYTARVSYVGTFPYMVYEDGLYGQVIHHHEYTSRSDSVVHIIRITHPTGAHFIAGAFAGGVARLATTTNYADQYEIETNYEFLDLKLRQETFPYIAIRESTKAVVPVNYTDHHPENYAGANTYPCTIAKMSLPGDMRSLIPLHAKATVMNHAASFRAYERALERFKQ